MKLPLSPRRRSATPLERALKVTSVAARTLPAVRGVRRTVAVARFTKRAPLVLGGGAAAFAVVRAARSRGGSGGSGAAGGSQMTDVGTTPVTPAPAPDPGTTAGVGIAPDVAPSNGRQGVLLGDAVPPSEGVAVGGAEVPGTDPGSDPVDAEDDLPSPAAAAGVDLPDALAAEGVLAGDELPGDEEPGLGAAAEAGALAGDEADVDAEEELDVDGPNESAPGHHPDEADKTD